MREASFQDSGTPLSNSCQEKTSMRSGPRGCHNRIVRNDTTGRSDDSHSVFRNPTVATHRKLKLGKMLPEYDRWVFMPSIWSGLSRASTSGHSACGSPRDGGVSMVPGG